MTRLKIQTTNFSVSFVYILCMFWILATLEISMCVCGGSWGPSTSLRNLGWNRRLWWYIYSREFSTEVWCPLFTVNRAISCPLQDAWSAGANQSTNVFRWMKVQCWLALVFLLFLCYVIFMPTYFSPPRFILIKYMVLLCRHWTFTRDSQFCIYQQKQVDGKTLSFLFFSSLQMIFVHFRLCGYLLRPQSAVFHAPL